MPKTGSTSENRLTPARDAIRKTHLAPETALLERMIADLSLDDAARRRIRDASDSLIAEARERASRGGFALGLVHRFGLNTPQGIALMQLAESLPRTVAARSAHELIADKIGALSWLDAVGSTSNFAERCALHTLDTLSRIFCEVRVDSAVQKLARAAIQKSVAVLGRQYVLGETLQAAFRNRRRWTRKGYRFSYDMLGEAAMTDAAAQAFHRSYLEAADFLGRQKNDSNAMSVKLSALHPRFEERQRERTLPLLVQRVKEIAIRARNADLQLTLDAEESERLELTLDVFEQLLAAPELRGWNGLGLAVQAYQRRALHVIDYLESLAEEHRACIVVRLVKGAYWDTEIKRAQQLGLSDYPIFVRKCDTDVSYLACARRLLARPDRFFPHFATHNAQTLASICELAKQAGNDRFELQRLHGMGEQVHAALLRAGFVSRIYAPIGPRRDLLPYLVRRLLENGASNSFVRQLTDATIPVERLARDPIEIATTRVVSVGVSKPTVVRNQSWQSAAGIDLAMRASAIELTKIVGIAPTMLTAGPLIDGALPIGTSRSVTAPSNRDYVIGTVIEASETQVHLAVAGARSANEAWRAVPSQVRADIFNRSAQLLEQRAHEFIRIAVLEAGKTLDDAIGEVREAADFCRYYAVQCQLPPLQDRQPLGTIACISPWNFPLAIFLGQVVGALAAGNTVVAKPAEQTPLMAMLATRLLHEAGVPTGALQFLPGDGRVGGWLTKHRDIAGIAFTGSVATAKAIATTLAGTQRSALPFVAETGGINAMIVDCSALPEQVVRDAMISAFQSAGQRCSSLRVLCLQNEIADRVATLLIGAIEQLQVGDPALLGTDVGPLIDSEAQRQVRSYLESRSILAQAPMDTELATRGTFVAPTLLEVERVADVQREIFGPVLHLVRYNAVDLPALLTEIDELGYGLTLGIHSRIRRRARIIADTIRVGNVYINRHQVAAMVGQQPFGGHGLSGTGPKSGGPHYLLRFSARPHRGQNPVTRSARIALEIAGGGLDSRVSATVATIRKAQERWRIISRQAERVQFACELLTTNTSHPLSGAATRIRLPTPVDLNMPLPNIVGEDNSLRLQPRGVLLAMDFATTLDALATQILLSIATGNGVLAIVRAELARELREFIAELKQMGVPDGLIACVETTGAQIPSAWLTELDIDGVVFDGSDTDRQRLAARLNERPGALLPLLSSDDDFYRFCHEQTLTINTAAAGGDPRLLAMTN